jgi:hypothetical protein
VPQSTVKDTIYLYFGYTKNTGIIYLTSESDPIKRNKRSHN